MPYTLLAIALGAYFLRFLWRLPGSTRWRFIIAGAISVTGALGIEFLEGITAVGSGEEGIPYAILNTVQEVMEFSGVIVFIDALLRHVRMTLPAAGPLASGMQAA